MDCSPLNNWYPIKLYSENNEHKCVWKYFNGIEFTDPFFNETISRAESLEINSRLYRSVSDLSVLAKWANATDYIEPSLFIFHISRCGSTLVSQALGLHNQHLVLSEVPFIDDILKLLDIGEWLVNTEYQAILKAAIKLYARKRNTGKNRLFIKTDSWHLYYLPLFRLLYPCTSFLFLFRKPEEVLLSQQKKRGMHAVPGLIANSILGLRDNISNTGNFDAHMINVLESYYASMMNIADDELSFLANYNQGIEQIIIDLASFINIDLDEKHRTLVNERCLYHAKFPDQLFKEEFTKKESFNDLNKARLLYIELERIRSLQMLKISSNIDNRNLIKQNG